MERIGPARLKPVAAFRFISEDRWPYAALIQIRERWCAIKTPQVVGFSNMVRVPVLVTQGVGTNGQRADA